MDKERREYCIDYLKARKRFRDFADKDQVLQGNDNLIGRIGEAIAFSFLERLGRHPQVNTNQTEPGYDIICKDNNEAVSVKIITAENKTGATSKIRKPFDSFIGIELDETFEIRRLAYISVSDFDRAISEFKRVSEPNFSRRMFGINNILGKYGEIYDQENLKLMDVF